MLVSEIWPDDLLELTEAGLKDKISRAAMAGALGAGLLGGGYGVSKLISPTSTISSEVSPKPIEHEPTTEPVRPTDNEISARDRQSHAVMTGATPHQGFPDRLHNQSSVNSADRVRNFRETIQPMINRVNAAILADRSRLTSYRNSENLSRENREWLNSIADRYDIPVVSNNSARPVSNIVNDLLLRVNVIPANLAMAQAALESGWGSSDLTRQANNLFGQKATNRHQDQDRIRNTDNLNYRRYENPEHSIRSYVHNLNTHHRYSEFRTIRAQLARQRGMTQDAMSRELSRHLGAYSTNPRYMTDLNRVMNMFRRS